MRPMTPLYPTGSSDRLYALWWPMVVLSLAALLFQVGPVVADSLSRALNPVPEAVSRPSLLADLYLFPDRLLAGAAGGFISVVRAPQKGRTRAKWVLLLISGAIMGNWLTGAVGYFFPTLADAAPASAAVSFFFGYAGFSILDRTKREANS